MSTASMSPAPRYLDTEEAAPAPRPFDKPIECTVSDALEAFDNPSRYLVEDVRVLEGPGVEITEVVSFTHTYAGQAREGERILARGKLERFTGRNDGYRVVVGTSREAEDEFIKLKELKI